MDLGLSGGADVWFGLLNSNVIYVTLLSRRRRNNHSRTAIPLTGTGVGRRLDAAVQQRRSASHVRGDTMIISSTRQFKHALLATAATLGCVAVPGAANAQAAAQPALNTSDQIVITGTRRTDRTVTNSASPIDVISSPELNSQPTANLLDTVKNIIPSFYVPQNTISDASTFVRAPSLARFAGRRSAGPGQRQALQPLGPRAGLYRRRHRPFVWLSGRGYLGHSGHRDKEPSGAA